VFRTYCSQWPLDEKRPVQGPPILAPAAGQPRRARWAATQAGLAAAITEAVVSAFAADRVLPRAVRPWAPRTAGAAELRSFL